MKKIKKNGRRESDFNDCCVLGILNLFRYKKHSAIYLLTVSCIMLKNGQTYFKKSCGVHSVIFLKCVWPFCNIMHEKVYENKSTISNDSQYSLSIVIKVIVINYFERSLTDEKPRGYIFSHKF